MIPCHDSPLTYVIIKVKIHNKIWLLFFSLFNIHNLFIPDAYFDIVLYSLKIICNDFCSKRYHAYFTVSNSFCLNLNAWDTFTEWLLLNLFTIFVDGVNHKFVVKDISYPVWFVPINPGLSLWVNFCCWTHVLNFIVVCFFLNLNKIYLYISNFYTLCSVDLLVH